VARTVLAAAETDRQGVEGGIDLEVDIRARSSSRSTIARIEARRDLRMARDRFPNFHECCEIVPFNMMQLLRKRLLTRRLWLHSKAVAVREFAASDQSLSTRS
jgi:hypothetical protein